MPREPKPKHTPEAEPIQPATPTPADSPAPSPDTSHIEGLNLKQQAFVQQYLVHLNATRAYHAAYGVTDPRIARNNGSRLLAHAGVAAAIAAARAKDMAKLDITRERVLRELAAIAFGDARGVMSWGPDGVRLRDSEELTDYEAASVAEVAESKTESGGSLKVKQHDKVRALDLLARHLGMYPEAPPAQVTNLQAVQIIVSGHDNV